LSSSVLIYSFTHRFGFVLQSCSTTYRTFWKCLSDLPVSIKSVTSLTPHSAPSFTTFTAAKLRTLEMCAALVSHSVSGMWTMSRDDKLITDGNCGLPCPDPKRFCADCNLLVACTSSKASARAWRSHIGTRELNNASGTSSAVRYQKCRLNAWVIIIIIITDLYSAFRSEDTEALDEDTEVLELLIGKYRCQPAHTVAVGWRAAGGASTACLQRSHHVPYAWVTNVANARSYGTWWRLGIVPDGSCPLLVTANAIFKPYI